MPGSSKDWFPRFFARIGQPDAYGCRPWLGQISKNGYGIYLSRGFKKRHAMAHRLSYEAFVGPIPNRHDIDHTCRNRACVNPWHLRPATRSENLRRGAGVLRSKLLRPFCRNGHAMLAANVVYDTERRPQCRQCRIERKRERRARLKAEA